MFFLYHLLLSFYWLIILSLTLDSYHHYSNDDMTMMNNAWYNLLYAFLYCLLLFYCLNILSLILASHHYNMTGQCVMMTTMDNEWYFFFISFITFLLAKYSITLLPPERNCLIHCYSHLFWIYFDRVRLRNHNLHISMSKKKELTIRCLQGNILILWKIVQYYMLPFVILMTSIFPNLRLRLVSMHDIPLFSSH